MQLVHGCFLLLRNQDFCKSTISKKFLLIWMIFPHNISNSIVTGSLKQHFWGRISLHGTRTTMIKLYTLSHFAHNKQYVYDETCISAITEIDWIKVISLLHVKKCKNSKYIIMTVKVRYTRNYRWYKLNLNSKNTLYILSQFPPSCHWTINLYCKQSKIVCLTYFIICCGSTVLPYRTHFHACLWIFHANLLKVSLWF